MNVLGLPLDLWVQINAVGLIVLIICVITMTLTLLSISNKLTEIMTDVIHIAGDKNEDDDDTDEK